LYWGTNQNRKIWSLKNRKCKAQKRQKAESVICASEAENRKKKKKQSLDINIYLGPQTILIPQAPAPARFHVFIRFHGYFPQAIGFLRN